MCQIARRYGKTVEANTVHHIFPRKDYPQYAWCDWNLISVSAEMHNKLEDRFTGKLTADGRELMRRTAKERGIRLMQRTLVIGLPGTGKTSYVEQHLGDGIVYDLDAIAAAFRLKQPHEEDHAGSRRMANDILVGFAAKAGEYADNIFVIRTAPTEHELRQIKPDVVVICTRQYTDRPMEYKQDAIWRIRQTIEFCREHSIPIRYSPAHITEIGC